MSIFAFSIVLVGSIIASFGIPSRSGRMGSAGDSLIVVGMLVAFGGVILVFFNSGWVIGIITGVIGVFIIPLAVSRIRA